MRVTDRMIFDSATTSSASARERLQQATVESSTGLRVSSPGDDPAAAGQIVAHRLASARYAAIASSAKSASDELSTADGALDGVGSALSRARELAVQLANESYSASDRAAAAPEVAALLGTIVGEMNTKMGNRYIFGGAKDQTPPFDSSGAYSGDATVRQVEVAPGVVQASSLRADVALKGAGGGADVFTVLGSLATALSNNDTTSIQAALSGLEKGISQLADLRSEAGTAINAFDAAATIGRAQKDGADKAVSNLGDADIIQSSSQLALAQRALDAALTAAASSFHLTLLAKLG